MMAEVEETSIEMETIGEISNETSEAKETNMNEPPEVEVVIPAEGNAQTKTEVKPDSTPFPKPKYESFDYFPPWSDVYKEWIIELTQTVACSAIDWRWFILGMMGFVIGIIGALVHQFIHLISHHKWEATEEAVEHGPGAVLGANLTYGLPCVFVAALLIALWPEAGGSGIPEMMGVLNGSIGASVVTPRSRFLQEKYFKYFNYGSFKPRNVIQTLVTKFWSCVLAVASGLPVGPEGPMVHMGGLIGAGLGSISRLNIPCFKRFRNNQDRQNFVSAGVAAGVASAFGAPIGGLLFSMEEVSSVWSVSLTWQTFFCCMIASFTTNLFNSWLDGFHVHGSFGLFSLETKFQVDYNLQTHLLTFIPAIALGIIGGVLGSTFIVCNTVTRRLRKGLLAWFDSCGSFGSFLHYFWHLFEPCATLVAFVVLSGVIAYLVPPHCSPHECSADNPPYNRSECLIGGQVIPGFLVPRTEHEVQRFTCHEGVSWKVDGLYTVNNQSFNQAATLLFGSGSEAIRRLFSKGTHNQLNSFGILCSILAVYAAFACFAANRWLSCGLVVPMLFIGGLYGRIIGQLMVLGFGIHVPAEEPMWAWIDPGAMAVIGAASFFAGVSRLTASLTVIMLEITNDISFLLPIMVAIMTSKWVGDIFTHSLYHNILHFKEVPFLDAEPSVNSEKKEVSKNGWDCQNPCKSSELILDLYTISDVMIKNPVTLYEKGETTKSLSRLLLEKPFRGFPVVNAEGIFQGSISRPELLVIVNFKISAKKNGNTDGDQDSKLRYEKVHMAEVIENQKFRDKLAAALDEKEDARIDLARSTVYIVIKNFST
ncbi:chloride channel protein C-like [Clavelina lepadiformis]|uniref:chloride channel protein C-like n=1 Tax=Clavelina lepadiformis TaxID=159417 RepID=UPI0040433E32